MHVPYQWRQTGVYDATNPGQKVEIHYTGLPGGYSSFYWNPEAVAGNLMGLPTLDKTTWGFIAAGAGLLGLGAVLFLRSRKQQG